ncbi:hypothetical protein D3C80_1835270 [compost metagenome]
MNLGRPSFSTLIPRLSVYRRTSESTELITKMIPTETIASFNSRLISMALAK